MPVFGEALDDDIMSTAGQLAARSGEGDSSGAVIEAIYVTEMPMSLPLDARLPTEKVERARAGARAREAGRRGVRGGGGGDRRRCAAARSAPAIVEAARRREVEAIVIGAEPPSPIRGGGMLGGVAGARPKELGEVTAYVLEKSPCRVLVTAPPGRRAAAEAGDGASRSRLT